MGFLLEYLRHPLRIGAVAPSSRFLAEKMLAPVDFSSALTMAELGAGTGAFTREILKRMHPRATLFAFEIHPPFLKQLEAIADKRLTIVNKPAEHLTKHVRQADAIISSLPLMAFPERAVLRILQEVKAALHQDGVYVQFQYTLTSRALLQQHFSDVTVDFTPLNIPPAFVYCCRK